MHIARVNWVSFDETELAKECFCFRVYLKKGEFKGPYWSWVKLRRISVERVLLLFMMHFDTAFDMCNFGLRVGENENKSLESTAILRDVKYLITWNEAWPKAGLKYNLNI